MERLFKRGAGVRSLPGSRSQSGERTESEGGETELLSLQREMMKQFGQTGKGKAEGLPERDDDRRSPDSLDKFVGGKEEKDRLRTLLKLIDMLSTENQEGVEHNELERQLRRCIGNYIDMDQIHARIDKAIGSAQAREYKFSKTLICPPTGFSKEVKDASLRRLKDIVFLFSTVPTFDNVNAGNDIRSFLMAMGSAVAGVEGSITAREFSYCIVNKLSSKVRLLVNTHLGGDQSLEALYQHLLVLYDLSHTPDSAWLALNSTNTRKFNSLKELLEYAQALMDVAGVEEGTRAPLFISILRNHIDTATYDRVLDWKIDYQKNYSVPLSMTTLMDYLGRFRGSINKHLERTSRTRDGGKVYNLKQGEPVRQGRPSKQPNQNRGYCEYCRRAGHTNETCWYQVKCNTCGGQHQSTRCRACKLCGSRDHTSVACKSCRCEPVAGACKYCMDKMQIKLFHPMSQCRHRPEKN